MNIYQQRIAELVKQIPITTAILDAQVGNSRTPTQATSDFLIHKEQGDWAEDLMFQSVLGVQDNFNYVPVKYGRNDNLSAGEAGFAEFYQFYQRELVEIGKRPDLLLFSKNDYNSDWGFDISMCDRVDLNNVVPLAKAGFEVRSSSYLNNKFKAKADRPFLAFTPKIEGLFVILRWIETYGVPHYYVQVFFDSIFVISFEDILNILAKSKSEKELFGKGKAKTFYLDGEVAFKIEKNAKNQSKETIHLFLNQGLKISNSVPLPAVLGNRKELSGGRLLHYASFESGKTILDIQALLSLIEKH